MNNGTIVGSVGGNPPHIHHWGTAWNSDASHHWHVCTGEEAMRWTVENGILNGYGDGRLGPQG